MSKEVIKVDVETTINGGKGLGLRWYIGRALIELGCWIASVKVELDIKTRQK